MKWCGVWTLRDYMQVSKEDSDCRVPTRVIMFLQWDNCMVWSSLCGSDCSLFFQAFLSTAFRVLAAAAAAAVVIDVVFLGITLQPCVWSLEFLLLCSEKRSFSWYNSTSKTFSIYHVPVEEFYCWSHM